MKFLPRAVLFFALAFAPFGSLRADENSAKAQQLATEVWRAAGGEHWGDVREISFAFVVEQNGKELMRAEHHWNLVENTDEVKWKDKSVKVNLASPATDDDGKAGYARWVNDSYWLLAPLKLRDPGANLAYEGSKKIAGKQCEVVRLSFGKVGLTPGDQYLLYIDPAVNQITSWDYMPHPDTIAHMTWDAYREAGGLVLSTEHSLGDKKIRIADLKVVAGK
jgi:hypothetical protein